MLSAYEMGRDKYRIEMDGIENQDWPKLIFKLSLVVLSHREKFSLIHISNELPFFQAMNAYKICGLHFAGHDQRKTCISDSNSEI